MIRTHIPRQKVIECSFPFGAAQDCLFLSLVVLLSILLYVHKLGFYSDDWAFLGAFSTSKDQSLIGLFWSCYDNWSRMRPAQILYLSGLYWLFGSYPLGYHLVNAAVLLSGIVLFYLVLRELGQPRVLSLAVPVVYALLPHYSTDRFWVAASPVTLSMTLYFLSLYGDLRALHSQLARIWGWRIISVLSLLGSTLTYEVALPLFFLNPLLVWYRGRQLYGVVSNEQLSRPNLAVPLVINLLALASVIVFKKLTTVRVGNLGLKEHIDWFTQLIMDAIGVGYGDYGLKLPYMVLRIFHDYPDWTLFATGGFLGLIIFGYIYRVANRSKAELPSQAKMLSLVFWGLVVFGLGYAIFLTNENAEISLAGINNRISIAAAVGVALSLVGALGSVSTLLPLRRVHKHLFCALVALLCTSGFLITNTLASFWIVAYLKEQAILADIRQHFPTLPSGSTLILDGICPYIGPAIIFESNWDLEGALEMFYHDDTLRADVVTRNLKVEEDGLSTLLYDTIYTHYPYNEKLFVYHVGRKMSYRLTDVKVARLYFQTFDPDHSSGCPRGKEGHGVPVF